MYFNEKKRPLLPSKKKEKAQKIYLKKQLKNWKPLPIPICLKHMYYKIER